MRSDITGRDASHLEPDSMVEQMERLLKRILTEDARYDRLTQRCTDIRAVLERLGEARQTQDTREGFGEWRDALNAAAEERAMRRGGRR